MPHLKDLIFSYFQPETQGAWQLSLNVTKNWKQENKKMTVLRGCAAARMSAQPKNYQMITCNYTNDEKTYAE